MKCFLAALLLAIAPTAMAQKVPAADFAGRLFFTPEQRAQLDILRTQRAVATKVRDEPVPEFVTYSGIVRRSDGQATVWVNGELLTEAELRNKQSIIGRIGRNGQILVQTPQAGDTTQVQLKVGQSAELLSGQVDEPFSTRRAARVPEAKPKAEVKPPAAPAVETAKAAPANDAKRSNEEIAPPVVRETAPRERASDAPQK